MTFGYLDNASPTDINNQSTPRLTITTGGNVGINETAPDRTLHVNSGATDIALILINQDKFQTKGDNKVGLLLVVVVVLTGIGGNERFV